MNVNNSCPCCSDSMLLHISSRRSFWLCGHCRVEIPHATPPKKHQESTSIKFKSTPLKVIIASRQSEGTAMAV